MGSPFVLFVPREAQARQRAASIFVAYSARLPVALLVFGFVSAFPADAAFRVLPAALFHLLVLTPGVVLPFRVL